MDKEKIKFINDSLGEAKEFSKEVRAYLYEIEVINRYRKRTMGENS